MNNVYSITCIVLAAGEGKRMYSKTPKVLHKLCGKSMIMHVIDCVSKFDNVNTVAVVGHGKDEVIKEIGDTKYVIQAKQLGTGHAVMQAGDYINDGDVLIVCGDTPLLTFDTLDAMYKNHKQNSNKATILTALIDNPSGYGRIIRDDKGMAQSIIEDKDATESQKSINEINSGIYFFDAKVLKDSLSNLNNNNAQNEYYLTDIIKIIKDSDYAIGAYTIEDTDEIMGVNNRLQLSIANEIMRKRINKSHMLKGVTIIDSDSTYIDSTVEIKRDVTILPNCIIEGNTIIDEDSKIGPNSRITDCNIGKGVAISNSVMIESTVEEKTSIGPFAYIRPGSKIGKHAKIGDFVEIKNSNFGDHSKVSHLTYIGDGDIGDNVNIGCGVVFVNYDGKNKHRSQVGDNSFIGCNSNLIAPVKISSNSYVAAGTTVTKDVPKGSLAVGRIKQENKLGWVKKRKLIDFDEEK